jgi:hypothetical protein
MEPQYKIWRDRGDNLGIQCTLCSKTFWTGTESVIDVTTAQPCSNCQMIKDQNILTIENQNYQPDGNDPSPYPLSQSPQVNGVGEVTV